MTSQTVQRWPSRSGGRSRVVASGGMVWTVANATDSTADFAAQVTQSLAMLDTHLREAGSARTHILSIQVLLADIADRDAFDALWRQWIGPDARHWPQRVCCQAAMAPGLRVELAVVAAQAGAPLACVN
jgi:enamine deaminase RidA (YjgF/YER057c/UK114 family)